MKKDFKTPQKKQINLPQKNLHGTDGREISVGWRRVPNVRYVP